MSPKIIRAGSLAWHLPRQPSPDPSPLSEAGGRALQFCRYLGCHSIQGVAVVEFSADLQNLF